MSVSLSNSFSSHFSDSFARTVTPQLDRRAHTERRTQMTPMPVLERPWARHALAAGFVGVILGSTGAMAVLTQRATAVPVQAALTLQAESALPAAAIMAPGSTQRLLLRPHRPQPKLQRPSAQSPTAKMHPACPAPRTRSHLLRKMRKNKKRTCRFFFYPNRAIFAKI